MDGAASRAIVPRLRTTSEGRSAARDGLKAEFAGCKPADIRQNLPIHCVRFGRYSLQRRLTTPLLYFAVKSTTGYKKKDRHAAVSPKLRQLF
jgi:hypothetical protein